MKAVTSWTLATALVLALGACNGNDNADTDATGDMAAAPAAGTAADTTAATDTGMPTDAATPPEGTETNAGAATTGAMPTEGEALGTVIVVDQHEIDTAKQAQDKKVTGKVLDYAKMMVADHTKNMEQARALDGKNGVTIAMTGPADMMKTKGQAEMQQLATMDGDAYSKAYVDAMVNGHTEVLNALDTQLIPAAKDAQVKDFLTTTRAAVAKHLEAAKALQTPAGQ